MLHFEDILDFLNIIVYNEISYLLVVYLNILILFLSDIWDIWSCFTSFLCDKI